MFFAGDQSRSLPRLQLARMQVKNPHCVLTAISGHYASRVAVGEIAYNRLSLEYAFGDRANQDLCASHILKAVDNAYQTWFNTHNRHEHRPLNTAQEWPYQI